MSTNLKTSVVCWLAASALFLFPAVLVAQCSPIAIATAGTVTLQCVGGTSNRSSVAFNPSLNLYYSVNAGSSNYPLETFSSNGAYLNSVVQGFDYRGAWWNSNTSQFEGNIYGTGIYKQNISATTGYPLGTGTVIFTGASQPSDQSVGCYDATNDQIVYYNAGSVYQYSRATNKLVATIAITGLPVATSNLVPYSMVYTGCTGKEYAVYDYTNRRVYFINRANGAYVTTSQLPATAPQPSFFGIAYANQLFWVFNTAKLTWNSYNVLTPSVLPLTLADLFAKKNGSAATLYWTSMNEVNIDKFTIERSTDAINFKEIESLPAIGSGTNNYQVTDAALPKSGMVYYRLKIYEKNGSFTYSQLATVTVNNQAQLFYISPNPAVAFATLTFSRPVQQATIAVYNSTGNRVLFRTLTSEASIFKLPVQNLAAGIYSVRVICADGYYQQKLLINK